MKTVTRDQEQAVMRERMGSGGRWRLPGKGRALALTLYHSSGFVKIFFLDVGHFIVLSLPNLLQYCFCFIFWGFWPQGTWILAP